MASFIPSSPMFLDDDGSLESLRIYDGIRMEVQKKKKKRMEVQISTRFLKSLHRKHVD